MNAPRPDDESNAWRSTHQFDRNADGERRTSAVMTKADGAFNGAGGRAGRRAGNKAPFLPSGSTHKDRHVKKFVLAAALALGASSGAMAQTPLNISLTGFCDTFALTLNGFEIYGTRSGCGNNVIDGGNTAKIGKNYLVTNDTNDGAEIYVWYFTPPKKNKGSWYLYESTGTSESEINSGAYTVTGTQARETSTVSATQKH
jgi:hypothetical protein